MKKVLNFSMIFLFVAFSSVVQAETFDGDLTYSIETITGWCEPMETDHGGKHHAVWFNPDKAADIDKVEFVCAPEMVQTIFGSYWDVETVIEYHRDGTKTSYSDEAEGGIFLKHKGK